MRRSYTARRGVILLCVLACMAIALPLVATALQRAIYTRRSSRMLLQQRQTEYLLEAGVQRAVHVVALGSEDDAWQENRWDASEAFPGGQAIVITRITRDYKNNGSSESAESGPLMISVEAEYTPYGSSVLPTRRSVQFEYLPARETGADLDSDE